MRKNLIVVILLLAYTGGCESLRFAPSEPQKQNAWLHSRTTTLAAENARTENASQELQALTKLSQLQSRAFVSYFGLPRQLPYAETAEDILAESNFQLAQSALQQASERPDPWQVADAALELGIGIFALLGGIYGTRVVRFLKQAKDKSNALREIIQGNELFKKQNEQSLTTFKAAQQLQSHQTRGIVAEVKNA